MLITCWYNTSFIFLFDCRLPLHHGSFCGHKIDDIKHSGVLFCARNDVLFQVVSPELTGRDDNSCAHDMNDIMKGLTVCDDKPA